MRQAHGNDFDDWRIRVGFVWGGAGGDVAVPVVRPQAVLAQ